MTEPAPMPTPSIPMVPVEITLGRRTYKVAAVRGEETRLKALCARVDALFQGILAAEPSLDRDHTLMLAALQLAADLADAHQRLDQQATAVTQFHRQLTERLTALLPAETARPAPVDHSHAA